MKKYIVEYKEDIADETLINTSLITVMIKTITLDK